MAGKAKLNPTHDLSTFVRTIKPLVLRFHQWKTGTIGYLCSDKVPMGEAQFQFNAPLYIVGTKGSPALPEDAQGNPVPPGDLPATITFGDLTLAWGPYVNPDTHTASVRAMGKAYPEVLKGAKCQVTMNAFLVGSSDLSAAERFAISKAKAEARAESKVKA